jgi:hypothetical protein
LGEAEFLEFYRPNERFESGAARRRRLYRETGSWQVVLDDMRRGWTGETPAESVPRTRLSQDKASSLASIPWPPRAKEGTNTSREGDWSRQALASPRMIGPWQSKQRSFVPVQEEL